MSIPLKDVGSSGNLAGLVETIGSAYGLGGCEASPWYEKIRLRVAISGSREYDDGVDEIIETYSVDEQITLNRIPIPSPDDSGSPPSPDLFEPDVVDWQPELSLMPDECYMTLAGTVPISLAGTPRTPADPRRSMQIVWQGSGLIHSGKIGEIEVNGSLVGDITADIYITGIAPQSSVDDNDPNKKFVSDIYGWTVDVLNLDLYRADDTIPTNEADARDLRANSHTFQHSRLVPYSPSDWDTSSVTISSEIRFL